MIKNKFIWVIILLGGAGVLHEILIPLLESNTNIYVRFFYIVIILGLGIGFVLKGLANVIEETTDVLSKRTKLAGGLLQSLGTAFPDMALGVVAALISLKLRVSDYERAINYAIIAAATTFGSNIYNIGHAAWCVYRQNLANTIQKSVKMFPGFSGFGMVKPIHEHKQKPNLVELDTTIELVHMLTIITALVATTMVLFGKVKMNIGEGDLYQLIWPAGVVLFIVCLTVLYAFRKSKRGENLDVEVVADERFFQKQSSSLLWISLLISGGAILLTAEAMVEAIQILSEITGISSVITGTLAGIIGCLGEMIVIHNYTIHPNGRIGDAITGVAMDNIVTTMGAAIVSVMGGIFLGGNALILIFVIILTLNTTLMWQISKLKNYFLSAKT